jgi:hypothetical protein
VPTIVEEWEDKADDTDIDQAEMVDPWLHITKWPSKFGSRPRSLILMTAKLPFRYSTHHRYLGTWNGAEVLSDMEDERRIWKILLAGRKMLNRCLWTLDDTPKTFRCCIKTTSESRLYYKPLERLQRKTSEATYCSMWMKLLTYVFRVWRLGADLNNEVYQLSLRPTEKKTMRKIWNLVNRSDDWCQDSEADNGESQDELHELVFKLSIKFWTHSFPTGDPNETVIYHFSDVMSISSTSFQFKRPINYTSVLAILTYLGRVMLLEFALPKRRYQHLEWPSRIEYGNQLERLHEVRKQYMILGGLYPMSEIILRHIDGKKSAKVEGGQAILNWSHDGQIMHFKGNNTIPMLTFRRWIHTAITDAASCLPTLMFNRRPTVFLDKLSDSMVEAAPGFSFIDHKDNNLSSEYRWLMDWAFIPGETCLVKKNGSWDIKRCQKYLKTKEKLLKQLLLLMHTTGGQPGNTYN